MSPRSTSRRRRAGFTLFEAIFAMGVIVLLAIEASAMIKMVVRRVGNERSRYNLSIENARAAHTISELARRSVAVQIFANFQSYLDGNAATSTGSTMVFTLPDASQRVINFNDTAIEFWCLPTYYNPLVMAGGDNGRMVTQISGTPYCSYVQGLARASWLAKAETNLGWTEQITYSAFAVPLRNR